MQTLKLPLRALLLSFLIAINYHMVPAQTAPSEPFTAVGGPDLTDASSVQKLRLQHVRDLPTTKSVHVLRLNDAVPIGAKIRLSIPNDKTFILNRTGGEVLNSKDFTWTGSAEGGEGVSATLVGRNGEVSGSINSPEGLYKISPLGGGLYAIAKVDIRKLPPEEPQNANRQQTEK